MSSCNGDVDDVVLRCSHDFQFYTFTLYSKL
jgi:hypothetical protein